MCESNGCAEPVARTDVAQHAQVGVEGEIIAMPLSD
jgi:hypothetical protein